MAPVRGGRKPYTVVGLRRMTCCRCPNPATTQWQICADDRIFRPLCTPCDVELNEMVMRWVWGDAREADLQRYRAKMAA